MINWFRVFIEDLYFGLYYILPSVHGSNGDENWYRQNLEAFEEAGKGIFCSRAEIHGFPFSYLGNSKKKHISRIPISRSLPSNDFEKSLTTSTSVENNGETYKHIMECISGLTKTVSTIATSIEPIVASWKNRGCPSDSDEDKIKGSPNIDAPHRSQPVTTPAIRISNVDSCQLIPPEHAEFHVSDKVDILDPYDGAIAGTGRIQSLAMIHGVPLSPEDANINLIDVTSNIPVAYEDTIDGCERLKETVKSFIRWPKKYLRKSSI